jgi:hypothetical protein
MAQGTFVIGDVDAAAPAIALPATGAALVGDVMIKPMVSTVRAASKITLISSLLSFDAFELTSG